MTFPHDHDPTGLASPTRSSGSFDYGELRERLARLETAAGYSARATSQHHDRLLTGDGRFNRLEERMTKLEQEGKAAIEDLVKVKELPKRIDAIEARSKAWKDLTQYGAALLVLALAVAGKIPIPEALKMFGKAFGLG